MNSENRVYKFQREWPAALVSPKHNLPQAAVLRLTPSGVSSQAAEFHKHVSSKDPD